MSVDPQKEAEKARQELADKIEKKGSIVHNIASYQSDNISKREDYQDGDLAREQVRKGGLSRGKQVVMSEEEVNAAREGKLNPNGQQGQQKPTVRIDGYDLPITNIPTIDAVTIMMYVFSTVFSKNPEVESILKQSGFKFPDANGNIIYPPQKAKKTKKRKGNDKSK